MRFKKSQSSLEFLLTFGIGFALILILSGIFVSYSQGAKESLDKSQLEKIGNEIIFNVEKIYFLGKGNRLTINSKFPDGIENFTIHHGNNGVEDFDYLNITYILDSEYNSEIFTTNEVYTRFNCTYCYNTASVSWFNSSDFSGGPRTLRITSKGNWVSVDFVKEE